MDTMTSTSTSTTQTSTSETAKRAKATPRRPGLRTPKLAYERKLPKAASKSKLKDLTTREADQLRKFRNRLRDLRVARSMSQDVLEKKAGLTITQVSQYEGGHRQPSLLSLIALARSLECTVDTLLGLD